MSLNSAGWTIQDDEKLVDLVKPHPELYDTPPSQKSTLGQIHHTWQEIACKITKPAEECKKRWRALHNEFIGNKCLGTLVHERRKTLQEKLQFLDAVNVKDQALQNAEVGNLNASLADAMVEGESSKEGIGGEQVITDNQEYYEIEIVDEVSQVQPTPNRPFIKLLPASQVKTEPAPKKIVKRNVGRKKSVPIPPNLTPVKILPKPLIPMREPRIVRCIETPKSLEQRSQTVDKLIEKVIRESTNEIDVFFRSMAASVKKLQPNLIPKVKMEVCNVIAKYEMQNFDKTS
ncbi:uncharacterized protein LOC121728174 [Aricia agestis]|uniref:uncharacterized protein LOC121728174 n=1 Tax=Aricia agestis TaxID=91739 RepID=UPI001C203C81|nr:uncharacterized protein LOC121728174 [Aricia agestis]